MSIAFTYIKQVTFKDVTIYGNVYFANYFLWQGEAREAFLYELIGDQKNFLNSGLRLVTSTASMKYSSEATLMDILEIDVIPSKISMTAIDIEFVFRKKERPEIISRGSQRIGFVDGKNEIVPLPKELLNKGKKYLSDELAQSVRDIEIKIDQINSK